MRSENFRAEIFLFVILLAFLLAAFAVWKIAPSGVVPPHTHEGQTIQMVPQ